MPVRPDTGAPHDNRHNDADRKQQEQQEEEDEHLG
jgi:hypothetical protein